MTKKKVSYFYDSASLFLLIVLLISIRCISHQCIRSGFSVSLSGWILHPMQANLERITMGPITP